MRSENEAKKLNVPFRPPGSGPPIVVSGIVAWPASFNRGLPPAEAKIPLSFVQNIVPRRSGTRRTADDCARDATHSLFRYDEK